MYWNKDIQHIFSPMIIQLRTKKTATFKIVVTSFMGLLAAIFQAAGGFIPVIGMLISPLATFPIIIGMLIGGINGLMGYTLTIFLLLFIQPSELFVFPFTTGLLAIGIGVSLIYFKKRWQMVGFSGLVLSIGICILLYALQFPILGPLFLDVGLLNILTIYLFSAFYSWVWLEFIVIKFLPRVYYLLKLERFGS